MIIQKIADDAIAPRRAHHNDAGLDLYAYEDDHIHSGSRKLIRTGIRLWLDPGTVGLVCPRSGLAVNDGITVLNAPGVIDEGFHGEIMVNLINLSSDPRPYNIRKGDRIAQLVLTTVHYPSNIEVVDKYIDVQQYHGSEAFGGSTTFGQPTLGPERGERGHGSTGL